LNVFTGMRFERKAAHSLRNHGAIPARAGASSHPHAEFGRLWEYTGTCVREAVSSMPICDSTGGEPILMNRLLVLTATLALARVRGARNTDFYLNRKGGSARLNCTGRQA
jgi:hypothetical protein